MAIQKAAIAAGIIAFVAIYAIGGIIIIFTLSLLSERIGAEQLMVILRFGGYLALAFPPYVAARAADARAFVHAIIVGVMEALAMVVLMTFTFSFEGTLQQYVLSRMLPVFIGVLALAMGAGALAEWRGLRDLDKKGRQ